MIIVYYVINQKIVYNVKMDLLEIIIIIINVIMIVIIV